MYILHCYKQLCDMAAPEGDCVLPNHFYLDNPTISKNAESTFADRSCSRLPECCIEFKPMLA